MEIKDDKVLSQNEFVTLLAELFSRGQALDMVDVSNEREHGNITDGQKFVYDAADTALNVIDLDKLFDNAEEYELAEKYPDFYEFLKEQCLLRDNDDHEERTSAETVTDETEEDIPEEIEEEPQMSMRDTVTKNLVEGHHTGKDSFNEKSRKADEFRAKLDEERRVAMEDAARAAAAAAAVTSNEREAATKAAETLKELQAQRQREPESRIQNDVSSTERIERNADNKSTSGYHESETHHESRLKEDSYHETESLPDSDASHSSPKENVERLSSGNRAEDITHTQHTGKENANDVTHVVKSPNAEKYHKQKDTIIEDEKDKQKKDAKKNNNNKYGPSRRSNNKSEILEHSGTATDKDAASYETKFHGNQIDDSKDEKVSTTAEKSSDSNTNENYRGNEHGESEDNHGYDNLSDRQSHNDGLNNGSVSGSNRTVADKDASDLLKPNADSGREMPDSYSNTKQEAVEEPSDSSVNDGYRRNEEVNGSGNTLDRQSHNNDLNNGNASGPNRTVTDKNVSDSSKPNVESGREIRDSYGNTGQEAVEESSGSSVNGYRENERNRNEELHGSGNTLDNQSHNDDINNSSVSATHHSAAGDNTYVFSRPGGNDAREVPTLHDNAGQRAVEGPSGSSVNNDCNRNEHSINEEFYDSGNPSVNQQHNDNLNNGSVSGPNRTVVDKNVSDLSKPNVESGREIRDSYGNTGQEAVEKSSGSSVNDKYRGNENARNEEFHGFGNVSDRQPHNDDLNNRNLSGPNRTVNGKNAFDASKPNIDSGREMPGSYSNQGQKTVGESSGSNTNDNYRKNKQSRNEEIHDSDNASVNQPNNNSLNNSDVSGLNHTTIDGNTFGSSKPNENVGKEIRNSYEAAGQISNESKSSSQNVSERLDDSNNLRNTYTPNLPIQKENQVIEKSANTNHSSDIIGHKDKGNIISHKEATKDTLSGSNKPTTANIEKNKRNNIIGGLSTGVAASAAKEAASNVVTPKTGTIKNTQNNNAHEKSKIKDFTPLNEIKDESDILTSTESNAMMQAMNRANGADFISEKEIADSYSIRRQLDSETLQMMNESVLGENRNIQSFGFANPQFEKTLSSSGNKVDAGVIASRQGNQVTLFVNDRPKQFTIRSGGTVNVGGLIMNVYQMDGNKAFVGWKGAVSNGSVIATAMNGTLAIKNGTNAIINSVGLAIEIKDNVKVFAAKVKEAKAVPMFNSAKELKEKIKSIKEKRAKEVSLRNGMSVIMNDDGGGYGLVPISMAPVVTTPGASDADFTKIGDSFTTNNFALKKRGKGINQILRETEFTKTLNKQGKYLHVFLRKKSYNFMRSIRFTNDDIQILAMNYDRILAMNCKDAKLLAKMNKELELKYLGAGKFNEYRAILQRYGICTDVEKLSQLVIPDNMPDEVKRAATFYVAFCKTHKETAVVLDMRERLKKRGITTDINKLGQLVKNGKLSGEDAILAQAYMAVYTQTRAEIIQKGILNGEFNGKKSRIEDAFLSASIPILMQEHGIPLNKREIRKLLLSGNISSEQLKLIQSYLLNRSAVNMMNLAKRLKNQAISGVKKVKHYANKYMGSDYTMRGLMMFSGVIKTILTSPRKTVRAIKRVRRFGSNVVSFGKASVNAASATARAAALAGKTTVRTAALAGKAVVRGVKTVQERGAKNAAKAGVRVLGGKIKNGFKMLKNFRFKMKNGGLSFLKTIVRILQVLMTSLLSILFPIILAIIIVLLMIFSFLSFIKNTGDEVYYDAGDEDTTEVIQEMVDVLTLCHASFRSALSNQFGGGGGEGGTASGTDSMNAPQMQKGDSSDVEKLYDVTTGTWWNNEGNIDSINWGYTCKTIYDKLNSEGNLKSSGGYAVTKIGDKTVFLVAMGSYWGKDGDVLKVTFNQPIALGNEPASNEIYVLKFDEKAWVDTGYPEQKEGLYGHPFGGHRDFLEFLAKDASSGTNMNGKGYIPQTATNMGNILDNTCDMATVGASGMAASTSVNADILYRQEITQETYRDILNTKTNVYYTFPKEQEQPEGITPTPTPQGYDKTTDEGAVYGFYNNNQELISMVLAMFDFDINSNTSVKQTVVNTKDTTGVDDESVKNAFQNGLTDKINADTWRLITYFDENGLDLTNYTIGGYDDLKYSTLVGLFNASHIVTGTKVTEYHQGADGLPVYDKLGKPGNETNIDGMSYQVPIMETYTRDIVNSWGVTVGTYTYTDYKRDEDGDICYETHYTACPGHTKYSAAVITLHFDSLLDIKKWWKKNIYNADDFDKENPNYESDNPKDDNYKAKSYTLKRTFQYIKKPDFYKGISGTCDQDSAGTTSSSAGFSPGTMTESQKEVAQKVYNFLTTEMSRKLSSEQAIGVLVNIKRECDFEYTQIEAGGGGGYGLTQWTGGRRDKLVQWCNAHGYKYNTLEGQLKMLENEFTTDTSDWTASIDGFYACTTARQAGEYFIRYYERPASEYLNQRINEMDQDIATVKSILS